MPLLIDGYNLLHASGVLPRGIGPGTLERARTALLNFLAASLEPGEIRQTTVVFDARTAPRGLPRIVDHEGLRVHYAPNPGDADELIEDLIRADSSPRNLVVVSGDHRLQRAARRRRATAVDSDVWYAEIVRRRAAGPAQSTAEPTKPAGPLSDREVAVWLAKFGVELTVDDSIPAEPSTNVPAAETPSADARAKREPPADSAKDGAGANAPPARSAKGGPGGSAPPTSRSAKDGLSRKADGSGRRGSSRSNPFPPGYGEDLTEENC